MLGLAHRGFSLDDPRQHILHTLRGAGYWTAMVGEQHVSADPEDLGYDVVVDADTSHAHDVAPATVALLRDRPPEPFFLSVGFFETHRDYFEPTSVRDALYSLPPANLPDSPVTRRDMASFKQSARALDHGVGAVLSALDELELADDTVVIFTTDHGIPFPGAKATLTRPRARRAADRARPGRLPRRPRERRAGLADRHLPDDLRADRDPGARPRPGPLAACRPCAATRATSTRRCTGS